MSSNHFDAFKSPNFPMLGESGVDMMVNKENLWRTSIQELQYYPNLSNDVGLIKLYPSMHIDFLLAVLEIKNLKVLIVETFGSGNIFTNQTFNTKLKEKVKQGLHVIVTTQCAYGGVSIGKYNTSSIWLQTKAISAKDLTTESAVLKAMHVLGNPDLYPNFADGYHINMSGEFTTSQNNFS